MKEAIFEMYKNISIGKNEICMECKKEIELECPLSIYFIGENFSKGEDTILFVGKTAVGSGEGVGELVNDAFMNMTDFGEKSIDGSAHNSSFYSYTNDIIKKRLHFK